MNLLIINSVIFIGAVVSLFWTPEELGILPVYFVAGVLIIFNLIIGV